MKDISIAEGVVPLGEFKSHAAKYLKELDSPLILTQNGRPAGVLVSPKEFDRIREQQRFLEAISSGLADAESGRVMDTSELKARLARARSDRQGR